MGPKSLLVRRRRLNHDYCAELMQEYRIFEILDRIKPPLVCLGRAHAFYYDIFRPVDLEIDAKNKQQRESKD